MPQVLASTSQVLGKRKQRLTRLSTVRLYLIDDVEVRQALSSWDMQTFRLKSMLSKYPYFTSDITCNQWVDRGLNIISMFLGNMALINVSS